MPDPLYTAARRVLLDALGALGAQRDATILVGAQAIYLHTGEADIAVAAFTTDGDLALDPSALHDVPLLDEAMRAGGFTPSDQPGIWLGAPGPGGQPITIDLLVPEALGGPGSRAARLGAHGKRAARKARGLEAAIIDNAVHELHAFDADDPRAFELRVAGPAALLIAKAHKLGERLERPTRLENKDALDSLRLLRATPTDELVARFQDLLANPRAAETAREGIEYLAALFDTPDAAGSQMAARAVEGLDDPVAVATSSSVLSRALLDRVGR